MACCTSTKYIVNVPTQLVLVRVSNLTRCRTHRTCYCSSSSIQIKGAGFNSAARPFLQVNTTDTNSAQEVAHNATFLLVQITN